MFCSKCGKEIAENAKFCDGCGMQLGADVDAGVQNNSNNTSVGENSKPKVKSKGKFIGGIALSALAFATIVDILFFKENFRAFDDNVLSVAEIISFVIVIGGLGGVGAWLLYKFVKENK